MNREEWGPCLPGQATLWTKKTGAGGQGALEIRPSLRKGQGNLSHSQGPQGSTADDLENMGWLHKRVMLQALHLVQGLCCGYDVTVPNNCRKEPCSLGLLWDLPST